MNKHSHQLPIRAKIEMAKDIGQIIKFLHSGEKSAADLLVEDLKTHAVYMDESVQQLVLMFVEQIAFQYDYDPWHKVTAEVQRSADRLIEALGFQPPAE